MQSGGFEPAAIQLSRMFAFLPIFEKWLNCGLFEVQIHPPRIFLEFFAEQRNAKSTPEKRRTKLRKTESLMAKTLIFCRGYPQNRLKHPKSARKYKKNTKLSGRLFGVLLWRRRWDLNPRSAVNALRDFESRLFDLLSTSPYMVNLIKSR